jgi:hypothetical protein
MGSVALRLSIRFALSGAEAFVLAGCGGGPPTEQAEREPPPDPKYLVAKASDFPMRFSLVSGETYPTSLAGAGEIFGHRLRRFEALFATGSRQLPMIERVGEETTAFRFDLGRLHGLTVAWRYRYVLASCTSLRTHVADLRRLVSVALAQQ